MKSEAISPPRRRPKHDLSDATTAFHAHVMGDQQRVLMQNATSATLR
jgi:non-haem Fe2+, alpha-ketoglutarate-dependent halogenase